jgi:hypothetical protein
MTPSSLDYLLGYAQIKEHNTNDKRLIYNQVSQSLKTSVTSKASNGNKTRKTNCN